jgi:hypothetical protein
MPWQFSTTLTSSTTPPHTLDTHTHTHTSPSKHSVHGEQVESLLQSSHNTLASSSAIADCVPFACRSPSQPPLMCVCVCVCVCVHRIYIHACVYNIYIYIYTYTRMYVYIRMYVGMHVCVRVTHTHTHTHTHRQTHVRTCARPQPIHALLRFHRPPPWHPTRHQPAPSPGNHKATIHVKLLLLACFTPLAAAPPISPTSLSCPGRLALHKEYEKRY